MFVTTNPGLGGGWRLAGTPTPPYRPPMDKGGQAVDDSHGRHLLTILAGPSPWQSYLTRAMANRATTVPSNFFRIVTSVSGQVPKHLQHLFARGSGGFVGGTIDRWTRTIYMVPAPGLRQETRLEYALHEAVHLFADPHAPTAASCPAPCIGTFQREYGTGFGEGLTQVITEDIMNAQGISRYYRDRPYDEYTAPIREVIKTFGADLIGRAYFFGEVARFTTAMDARWGAGWHAVAALTRAKRPQQALAEIARLEAAHAARIQQMLRQAPKGDFPTPSRTRMYAGLGFTPTARRLNPQAPPPQLRFLIIDDFDVGKSTVKPAMKTVLTSFVDHVKASWQSPGRAIGVVRLKGHTDSTGHDNFNRDLGNWRAEAVKREIVALLGPVINRVLVEIEASPGKAQPVADNRTVVGRARNRRVDIYIEGPIPPAPPWPGPPPRGPITIPDIDKGEPWDPYWFRRGGFPEGPLGGKSVQEVLMDLCAPVFGRRCKDVVDKAIEKGCEEIAGLLEKWGAPSDKKEEVMRRCREAASKRVR